MTKNPHTGKSTRAALINAGVRLFGEQGFDTTSTRQIVQAVSYYFGGRQGYSLPVQNMWSRC